MSSSRKPPKHNYYEILGVKEDAKPSEIKKQFVKLCVEKSLDHQRPLVVQTALDNYNKQFPTKKINLDDFNVQLTKLQSDSTSKIEPLELKQTLTELIEKLKEINESYSLFLEAYDCLRDENKRLIHNRELRRAREEKTPKSPHSMAARPVFGAESSGGDGAGSSHARAGSSRAYKRDGSSSEEFKRESKRPMSDEKTFSRLSPEERARRERLENEKTAKEELSRASRYLFNAKTLLDREDKRYEEEYKNALKYFIGLPECFLQTEEDRRTFFHGYAEAYLQVKNRKLCKPHAIPPFTSTTVPTLVQEMMLQRARTASQFSMDAHGIDRGEYALRALTLYSEMTVVFLNKEAKLYYYAELNAALNAAIRYSYRFRETFSYCTSGIYDPYYYPRHDANNWRLKRILEQAHKALKAGYVHDAYKMYSEVFDVTNGSGIFTDRHRLTGEDQGALLGGLYISMVSIPEDTVTNPDAKKRARTLLKWYEPFESDPSASRRARIYAIADVLDTFEVKQCLNQYSSTSKLSKVFGRDRSSTIKEVKEKHERVIAIEDIQAIAKKDSKLRGKLISGEQENATCRVIVKLKKVLDSSGTIPVETLKGIINSYVSTSWRRFFGYESTAIKELKKLIPNGESKAEMKPITREQIGIAIRKDSKEKFDIFNGRYKTATDLFCVRIAEIHERNKLSLASPPSPTPRL